VWLVVPGECSGLTAQKLTEDGVFLFENGVDAILYFGMRADPGLVRSVLGVPLSCSGDVMTLSPPGPCHGHVCTLKGLFQAGCLEGKGCIAA
jgi:hypothetical protein